MNMNEFRDAFATKVNNRVMTEADKATAITKFIKEKRLFCPVCGQPMTHCVGTNVMVCSNDRCRGNIRTFTDKAGEAHSVVNPVFVTLSDSQAKYADKIFG